MIIAIDPGGRHCGVAVSTDGSSCTDAFTLGPREFEDWLAGTLRLVDGHGLNTYAEVDLVIYEGYRVYPWAKDQQTWSRVETVEVIGVILYLCRQADVETKEQLPPIKKPTKKIAPKLGWEFRTGDQHTLDAQYHLAYHLLRLEHNQ